MAGFFNGGFFNGGGMQDDDDHSSEVDNQKLYDVLGVPKTATQDEIRKAFRKLAIQTHPDRGGDAEIFKEVNAANEILSKPEKREIYDKYGFAGLKGGNENSGFGDIFDIFFGGRHAKGQTREAPQLKPTVMQVDITLEEAFHGKMFQLDVERLVVCASCTGKGGLDPKTCPGCKGRGVVIKMVQLGPGMYTQSQADCKDCQGTGKFIEKQNICKECKGQKMNKKTEKVDVPIPVGIPDEEKIVIKGKGNEHYEYRTGDLVVIVKIKENSAYKRVKNDLHIEKKISLIEALEGFSFNLDHLNTHTVTIKTAPGDITTHKDVKKVANLGMPHYKSPMSHGDLYVHFTVEFPKSLTKEQSAILAKVLPGPILPKTVETKNVYELTQAVEVKHSEKQGGHYHGDEEEEEEEEGHGHPGGQRVECGQQ